jgi:hypothetical protein
MAGSLEFIKSASGTSVSSLDVTDCFSDKYDVYKITYDLNNDTFNIVGNLRFLDSGGSVISASEYDYAALNLNAAGTFVERRGTSQTSILRLTTSNTNTDSAGFLYIYNPYDSSSYTFVTFQNSALAVPIGSAVEYGVKGIGVHKSAETISGINILVNSGNWNSIEVSVYGVK